MRGPHKEARAPTWRTPTRFREEAGLDRLNVGGRNWDIRRRRRLPLVSYIPKGSERLVKISRIVEFLLCNHVRHITILCDDYFRMATKLKSDKPALISRDDLASVLGVSTSSLILWANAGRGPMPLRVGRRIYYRVSDVLAWMEPRSTSGNRTAKKARISSLRPQRRKS